MPFTHLLPPSLTSSYTLACLQPHRLLHSNNVILHKWTAGLRYSFKRLLLIDSSPPLPMTPTDAATGAPLPGRSSAMAASEGRTRSGVRHLKLALHRTRQSWSVHYDSLYRLLHPRRAALFLNRAVVRTAANVADGTASIDAPPRVLYYSRVDAYGRLVVKGERNLIDALRAKFGAALAIYRGPTEVSLHTLVEAAKTFGAATAIVAPHGAGLANLIYCEFGTPLFLLPTYDAASPEHIAPPPPLKSAGRPPSAAQRPVGAKDNAVSGAHTSLSDSPYTYLAAATGMPVHLLPQSKAWTVHGNFSMPPYLSVQAVDTIARELIRMGRWKPPHGASPPAPPPRDATRDRTGDKATDGSQSFFSISSFLLPFISRPPPPVSIAPPSRLPTPKPPPVARPPPPLPPATPTSDAPSPASSPLPSSAPAPTPSLPAATGPRTPPLPTAVLPPAGAFAGLSALEQPFGRGFRMVLPETLGSSTLETMGAATGGGPPTPAAPPPPRHPPTAYMPSLGTKLPTALPPNVPSPRPPPPQVKPRPSVGIAPPPPRNDEAAAAKAAHERGAAKASYERGSDAGSGGGSSTHANADAVVPHIAPFFEKEIKRMRSKDASGRYEYIDATAVAMSTIEKAPDGRAIIQEVAAQQLQLQQPGSTRNRRHAQAVDWGLVDEKVLNLLAARLSASSLKPGDEAMDAANVGGGGAGAKARAESTSSQVGVGANGQLAPVETPDDDPRVSTMCPHWAALRECEESPNYMLAKCPRSCATVTRFPTSLRSIVNETGQYSTLSLTSAEVRAFLWSTGTLQDEIEQIIRDGGERPAWFIHDSALNELVNGKRYLILNPDKPGGDQYHAPPAPAKTPPRAPPPAPPRAPPPALPPCPRPPPPSSHATVTKEASTASATRGDGDGEATADGFVRATEALERLREAHDALSSEHKHQIRLKIAKAFNIG